MAYWLAIGPSENWKIGIKNKLWAVGPPQSKSWEKIEPGDTVFFYVTTPVKGLIGYGKVEKTRVKESPFWPQEKEKGHALWPFQITFSEVSCLDQEDWQAKAVHPERKGIVFQRAFQPVDTNRAKQWLSTVELSRRVQSNSQLRSLPSLGNISQLLQRRSAELQ
ncbi:MAG TPA: hypothetical protein VKZ59_00795 [Acidobacteriota bacterium]|nr:hypothetical protein [Acidobacteriota bacterium]